MVRKLGEYVGKLFIQTNGNKMQEIGLDLFAYNMIVQVNMLRPFMEALIVSFMPGCKDIKGDS